MIPSFERVFGRLLRPIRGHDADLLCNDPRLAVAAGTMKLTSPAFAEGGDIPSRYAGRGVGENVSPPLAWSGVPAETVELVLVMQDPDAPLPRPVTHLVATDIAVDSEGVEEGMLRPETNPQIAFLPGSLGRIGYEGPRPIRGHGPHRYVFQLFALARVLPALDDVMLPELASGMAGWVLARAVLTGIFELI
ncbi:YbhB/YbcL family Raf kinase inhibitor-like protein [Bosea sp. UNC402CLCol]|uniref:YbhB/YbcL family Raf kinase inhibitor-like protein n=1 Tax=Bosea sp. UNC402CLCol TaxID=1510531 RepID=UPI000570CD22|nr:YbhB/YbcL family Raf kinase inhibitor-like protein [Bosea sp. UNC402CLCol]